MTTWYERNRDRLLARQRERYHTDQAHRAKVVGDSKAWYRAHRVEVLARLHAQRVAARSASVSLATECTEAQPAASDAAI